MSGDGLPDVHEGTASDEQQANLEQALEEIDDLLGVLREIDERILEDTSGGILQRWDRLDRLLKLKEKADG